MSASELGVSRVADALARPIRDSWPVAIPVSLIAISAALSTTGSNLLQREATGALINLVLVVGLYVFAGTTGILSFGHVSFMAVAAYVTALVSIPPRLKLNLLPHVPTLIQQLQLTPIEAALLAALVSAAFAVLLSIPLMRLSGLTASVAMFAVLLIVYEVARSWVDVTRGTLTMLGLPATVTLVSATGTAIAVVVVAYLFQQSKVGLQLRASREDEPAAAAIGIDVVGSRRVAFTLSAFLVGIGGFEYAQFYTSFNPDAFYLNVTFITIAMLVVGGMLSLTGAVVGVIALSALLEILREIQEGMTIGPIVITSPPGLREVGAAVAMLSILILRPAGLVGSREISWPATVNAGRRLVGASRRIMPRRGAAGKSAKSK
jgi:branched-chain amino acid transport system permease protein